MFIPMWVLITACVSVLIGVLAMARGFGIEKNAYDARYNMLDAEASEQREQIRKNEAEIDRLRRRVCKLQNA